MAVLHPVVVRHVAHHAIRVEDESALGLAAGEPVVDLPRGDDGGIRGGEAAGPAELGSEERGPDLGQVTDQREVQELLVGGRPTADQHEGVEPEDHEPEVPLRLPEDVASEGQDVPDVRVGGGGVEGAEAGEGTHRRR